MTIFFTIAIVAFMYILLTSAFGHGTDGGHDLSHDLGHDAGQGNQDDQDSGHLAPLFNTRVLAMFLMGFGGAGGVARFYQQNYPLSCMYGIAVGVVLGLGVFYILAFFASQQANSLTPTSLLVGSYGTVEVAVRGNEPGEVAISANDRFGTYIARARDGTVIDKGNKVIVVDTVGSDVIVEKV